MTDEVSDLIRRLNRQARMYEAIDAGTGYGYDKDAGNIREAVRILRKLETAYDAMKRDIIKHCEDIETYKTASRYAMVLKIEANILSDLRSFEHEVLGRTPEKSSTETAVETDKEIVEVIGNA